MKEFGVKSAYYSLFEAFAKEAQMLGITHNPDFSGEFKDRGIYAHECLWFSTKWAFKEGKKMYAFSGSDTNIFVLENEWQTAIKVLSDFSRLKIKKTVTIQEIAAWKGWKPYEIEIVDK